MSPSLVGAASMIDVLVLDNGVTVAADGDGTAVDITDFEGSVNVILAHNNTAGTLPTLTAKVTESATSGGTYTDAPGGAFAAIAATDGKKNVLLDRSQLKGFVKVNFVIGGTGSPSFLVTTVVAGYNRYRK